MRKSSFALAAALAGGLAALAAPAAAKPKEKAAEGKAAHEAASGVSGSLSSIGSDTLNNLMSLWAEGFKKLYPSVKIEVEGKGSSTAPPALIAGTAQLGPMSREMKGGEIDAFERKYGYKPTQVRVALDALSVWVNKDNPVEKLKLEEVDALFSKTRRGGLKSVENWSLVGGSKVPVSLYGRNSASGTYGFFKDHALFGGDFKPTVKEQPGSASVVQGVGRDRGGVGYSGMGYKTSLVKALAIAPKGSSEYVAPTPENVYNKTYPLRRYLYVYVNKAPNKALDPVVAEFLKYVLSKAGQEVTLKDGFLAVPAEVAAEDSSKLGL